MFHVVVYKRAPPAEVSLNNQMDKMTHAIDVSQPLSPAEMEVIHGVSNMDFAHKDQLGFSHY